ncbi:50S ribosomal protein L25 [bacterium]|nr:50S ribosomal protein L25 [bacterium]
MELHKMNAQTRPDISKPEKKAWRAKGFIPSVLYGGEGETIPLALNEKIWQKLFNVSGSRNMILDLVLDDNTEEPDLVKVGEVQRHPARGNLLHVDLIRLARGVTALFEVPIRFIGKAEGEKAGGILMKHHDYLDVESFPRNVPDVIEIDITPFELTEGLHVGEIPWDNEDVKIVTDPGLLIFSIEVPKVIEEPVAEELEEGVEGEEGAEPAEGAEGDESAEKDKKHEDDDKKKKHEDDGKKKKK